jgi:tetratricopeptide (TPR) repeat protein
LSGNDPFVLTDYAAVLSQAGEYPKALSVLNALLDQQPYNVTVLFLKANAQLELGQAEQSKETVKQLLAINPDYPLPQPMRE